MTDDLLLTRTDQRLLTPAYASPEQVRGEVVTTASDVYALGVVLYELLTNQRPYRPVDESARALESAILETNITRPSTETTTGGLRRRLSGDLDNICLMALRKEPDRRYPSAAELKADIDRHLAGEPVAARGDSPSYRFRKFVDRHRGAVVGTGLGLIAVVGLTVGYTVQLTVERDRARQESRKATEVVAFMTDLLRNAAPEVSLGETVTVRELLDRGAERIGSELETEPEVQATMMYVLGHAYNGLGRFDQARDLLARAVASRRTLLGDEHSDLAEAQTELGDVLRELGAFEEAEPLLRDAIAINREVRGPGSAAESRALQVLAVLLTDVGRRQEAAELYPVMIENWKTIGDSASYASALSNFAQLHTELDDHVSPIPMFEEALAIQERVYPDGHPELATTMYNLSTVRRQRGELAEATVLSRRGLELDRKIFGNDHFNVAFSLTSLALTMRERGLHTEGEPLLREALRIRKNAFGDVHSDVASGLGRLGRNLHDQGRLEEAEALIREAVEVTIESLDPMHPSVSTRMNDLGWVLRDQGRWREAIETHRKVYADCVDRDPTPGFTAGISLGHLSRDYDELGEIARADSLARAALAVAERLFPDGHPFVAACRAQVGWMALRRGDYDAAYDHQSRSTVSVVEAFGLDSFRTYASYRRLARVLRARGEFEEARRLLTDVLRFQNQRFGTDHWQTSATRAHLGGLELDAGDPAVGIDLLERAWPIVAKRYHARDQRRRIIERDLERGRELALRDS
jgi:serine/threonine-protein kinase